MTEKTATRDSYVLAWADRRAWTFFVIIAIVVLGIDLASKSWAFCTLSADKSMVVWPGVLSFALQENAGAVFGMGQGGRWIFVAATAAAMLFIVQLFARSGTTQRGLQFLLALSLGGALGNLYDRLVHGVVRDFIQITLSVHYGGQSALLWPPVFNVADVALVIGIGLLLIGWVFGWIHLPCDTCAVPNNGGHDKRGSGDDQSESMERS